MKESRNVILLAVFTLSLAGTAIAADNQQSAGSASSGATAGGTGATMQQNTVSRADERIWERQHRASKIIGTDVYDLQGKKIGEVRDVVLNPKQGNIDYAVVSFGGVMGVGSKYFAVPWNSLQATSDATRYMLNVDKDALKSAPGFDKNRWPDMANQQWKSEVDRYWQNRSGGTSTGGTDSSRGAAGSEKSEK
ncbi:MAG: PRC-barrel domain-containing protein [Burkholderiales bacterium]|nr:PRC-barrel domain-containing protein [Burkholderiales bacterium]